MARWVGGVALQACPPLPSVCAQLKDDAVVLADVLAPPDAILQAAIGRENGEVKAVQRCVKWLQLA